MGPWAGVGAVLRLDRTALLPAHQPAARRHRSVRCRRSPRRPGEGLTGGPSVRPGLGGSTVPSVSVWSMPRLNALGIVVSDMATSIRFYRLLGLDVPETADEGHVDTFLPNGVRFMLDSEEVVRSFRADWNRETGNQLALAFECESPAEVDAVYTRVVEAGFDGEKEPWDA